VSQNAAEDATGRDAFRYEGENLTVIPGRFRKVATQGDRRGAGFHIGHRTKGDFIARRIALGIKDDVPMKLLIGMYGRREASGETRNEN